MLTAMLVKCGGKRENTDRIFLLRAAREGITDIQAEV